MKKQLKAVLSLALAIILIASLSAVGFSAGALEKACVRVIVTNDTYSTESGAPWQGTTLDEVVELKDTDTVVTVIKNVLAENGLSCGYSDWDYFTEIGGISEYQAGSMSGWMFMLNDWFTPQGASAYTVENGGLSDGDEITLAYSCSWGYDLKSQWGNTSASLDEIAFEGCTLNSAFNPDVTSYTLTIDGEDAQINVRPSAANKNYQTRIYLNEYTPEIENSEYKRSSYISVEDGDVIYVGVANPAWPTMESESMEAVYSFKIVGSSGVAIGDVDQNGEINVNDATLIQKYLVNLEQLSEKQKKAADVNGDGEITIADATDIQKKIANII